MENASKDAASGRRELCGKTLGDYTIVRRIGGGATSDVFLAKQNSLERNVALKILKDDLAEDATYVARFIHEARAAARLEHPNVVRIYEVGELVDDSAPKRFGVSARKRRAQAKRRRFIAQEYVEGLSLAQYLHRNGSLAIEQTFAVLEQIAAALQRAADFNLIHRDVKPENVILDSSGVVHVVDFGLARPVESRDATWTDGSLTRAGVVLGTPLYMSPEQARGHKLDSRSDVYSLGVTGYHMLVGAAPFQGDTPLSIVLKHLHESPRPILELRPDVPQALAELIERMLTKNPDERPASPAALLKELKEAKLAYLRELAFSMDSERVAASVNVEMTTAPQDVASSQGVNSSPSARADSLQGESNAVDFVANTSFFQTEDERKEFESAIHTTALSMEWRANVERLDAALHSDDKFWTTRRIAKTSVSLVVAFLLGGGALTYRNMRLAAATPEPPLSIQRFDTVEEQYVFALQTGTVDAWKSVIEYYPEDDYWILRAKRQLALVYVGEDDVESAETLFEELAVSSGVDVAFDPFPLAGIAWVAATRGDVDAATTRISELSYYRTNDRMTDVLLSKTRELIQVQNAGLTFPSGGRGGGRRGRAEGRPNGRADTNAPVGGGSGQVRRGFLGLHFFDGQEAQSKDAPTRGVRMRTRRHEDFNVASPEERVKTEPSKDRRPPSPSPEKEARVGEN